MYTQKINENKKKNTIQIIGRSIVKKAFHLICFCVWACRKYVWKRLIGDRLYNASKFYPPNFSLLDCDQFLLIEFYCSIDELCHQYAVNSIISILNFYRRKRNHTKNGWSSLMHTHTHTFIYKRHWFWIEIAQQKNWNGKEKSIQFECYRIVKKGLDKT